MLLNTNNNDTHLEIMFLFLTSPGMQMMMGMEGSLLMSSNEWLRQKNKPNNLFAGL